MPAELKTLSSHERDNRRSEPEQRPEDKGFWTSQAEKDAANRCGESGVMN